MSLPTEVTCWDNLRGLSQIAHSGSGVTQSCAGSPQKEIVCVLTSHSKIRTPLRSPTDLLLTLSLQSCWVLARSQSKFVRTQKMPDTEAQGDAATSRLYWCREKTLRPVHVLMSVWQRDRSQRLRNSHHKGFLNTTLCTWGQGHASLNSVLMWAAC